MTNFHTLYISTIYITTNKLYLAIRCVSEFYLDEYGNEELFVLQQNIGKIHYMKLLVYIEIMKV